MLKVEHVKILEKNVKPSKALDDIVEVMKKYGISDPMSMLPKTSWYEISFILKNTYSGFANGIRRALIEELPTKCLHFDEKDIETDDEYILSDLLTKNINLVPILQDIEIDDYADYNIFLYKYNDTNEIIDVKASDIKVVLGNKRKSTKGGADSDLDVEDNDKDVDLNEDSHNDKDVDVDYDKDVVHNNKDKKKKSQFTSNLIPNSNITVVRLRPGKYLKVTKLSIIEGYSKNSADKFTLISNIKYNIIDMKPNNIYTGTGTRSIEQDPKEFSISFTTSANIHPYNIIKLLCSELQKRLTKCKDKLIQYMKTDQTKKYYYDEGFEVTNKDEIYTYKYIGEYITLAYMLAQRCYILDNNVTFCSPAIDRYDNEIAIIKLKHADTNKLLLKAIESCMVDIDILQKEILSTKITNHAVVGNKEYVYKFPYCIKSDDSFPYMYKIINNPMSIYNTRNDYKMEMTYELPNRIPVKIAISPDSIEFNALLDLFTEYPRILNNSVISEYFKKNKKKILMEVNDKLSKSNDKLNDKDELSKLSNKYVREILDNQVPPYRFNILLGKTIIDMVSKLLHRPVTIYDPFGNYGEKMLSALISDNVLSYTCTVDNSELKKGFDEIIKFGLSVNKVCNANYVTSDALKHLKKLVSSTEENKNYGKYDLVFTNISKELLDHTADINDWKKKYLEPILQNLLKIIKLDGIKASFGCERLAVIK